MPVDGLKQAFRQYVLSLINQVQPEGTKYKFLILDSNTSAILKYVFDDLDEFLNYNISAIEYIDRRRPPVPNFEAIYFLFSDDYSVDCLLSDYHTLPRYAAAHVFFFDGLSPITERKLRTCKALDSCLKTLSHVPLGFYPIESQVYSFKDPNGLEKFYNKNCYDLINVEAKATAKKLASLCALFGEYPLIRYYRPRHATHEASALPYMLADALYSELEDYARAHPEFPSADNNRPRSIFLIVDRSLDLKAPLLHEFTFQAMAEDLLPIKDGNRYTFKMVDADGLPEEKKAVINDSDPLWQEIRLKHMQDASSLLMTKLEQLKKENPHFVDKDGAKKVSDLQDMLAGLPMFTEMRDKFSLYIQMATECMQLFEKRKLASVATVEQDSATGEASDGSRPKGLTAELVTLLDDPTIGKPDRLRLVILYILYRHGLILEDFEKLAQHSGLNAKDLQMIRNLETLGATIVRDLGSKVDKDTTEFSSAASGDVYETSRYVPGLKNVIEMHLNNSLDTGIFPYFKTHPPPEDNLKSQGSLRNPRQRAVWAKPASTFRAPQQRIFVFSAGGLTYSEIRAAYEVTNETNRDVYMGANDIITPNQWISRLLRLNLPREALKLPEDQPKRKAPAFLFESPKPLATNAQSAPATPANALRAASDQNNLQKSTSESLAELSLNSKEDKNGSHHHHRRGLFGSKSKKHKKDKKSGDSGHSGAANEFGSQHSNQIMSNSTSGNSLSNGLTPKGTTPMNDGFVMDLPAGENGKEKKKKGLKRLFK